MTLGQEITTRSDKKRETSQRMSEMEPFGALNRHTSPGGITWKRNLKSGTALPAKEPTKGFFAGSRTRP